RMVKDAMRWNIRASLVYAVGVWTMIGSYAFFKYTGLKKEEEEEVQELEDPNRVVIETAHTKTTIIYRKDFVPYTTRIYNYIKSFSSEPGTGDGENK
uniref:Uncharacterized protein n=1 Tax=Monopterus albus TaxID=43700 RepID=A0A3Q3IS04_MONAL